MEGQGWVMATYPPPVWTTSPFSFKISAEIPGNAFVAEPGLVVVIPGSGVIIIAPVSVCHKVSTAGHFFFPIFSWYHIHASGLIGSPTLPSSLKEERSAFPTHSVPHFMKVRMAVGAV